MAQKKMSGGQQPPLCRISTVKAVEGNQPSLDSARSLKRYWTLTGTGITANLVLHYLDPTDIAGNESAYRLIRVSGGTPAVFPDGCASGSPCVNPATNSAMINGVSSFSDWTVGELTGPTAVEMVSFNASRYDMGTSPDHSVSVALNGVFVGRLLFDGRTRKVERFSIYQSLLREGNNILTFMTDGGAGDVSLVDYVRVSYWHTATADDDALRLTTEAGQPSQIIDGFSSPLIRVLDVTDPAAVTELLVTQRQKQGWAVALIDTEDLFDEFNFGHKSPQAVKDFLSYAATSWKRKPKYVLLAGDASYDGRNYLGLGQFDLIPTKLIDTAFMEAASDDWLADFNNDGLAELAVGRLPMRTASEATKLVAKLTGYEQSTPVEEALLVADQNESYLFEQASDSLRAWLPATLRINQLKRGQLDAATAKEQLLAAINRGQKIVNYTGHGSVSLWRGNLLTNLDAAAMTNGNRLSVFVLMTCLNGYFDDPVVDSLAESLMKAERGGAVAVWASSGMCLPDEQAVMNRQIYRLLFDPTNQALGLGEVMRRAKASIADADIRRTWILLGDPTMRLK
jgi:peptidase C25-like protein